MVRLRRYNVEEVPFFVTTSVQNKDFNLTSDDYAEIVIDYIFRARERFMQHLLAFAIMPDHLLFVPKSGVTISQVLHYIKRGSSRVIHLREGLDGNLWTRRFHDAGIRSQEQLTQTAEYIHNNPVKAKLVEQPEDYPYSSANPRWTTDLMDYLTPR